MKSPLIPSEHWLADELPYAVSPKMVSNDLIIGSRLLRLLSFLTLWLALLAHQQVELDFTLE